MPNSSQPIACSGQEEKWPFLSDFLNNATYYVPCKVLCRPYNPKLHFVGGWNPKQALGKLDWKSPLAETKRYLVSLMVITNATFKTFLRFLLLDFSEVNFMYLSPFVDYCPLNSLWWLMKYKFRFVPACFSLLSFPSCSMWVWPFLCGTHFQEMHPRVLWGLWWFQRTFQETLLRVDSLMSSRKYHCQNARVNLSGTQNIFEGILGV